jgi:ubiquitin carboxyl-terminal hydrolase 22/27/51
MSVILQSFIHNPIVRNFFLSGGHDRAQCTFDNCLACCVDQIFADFFNSNNIRGYGIAPVLTASYMLKKTLAGASEQDAHEFFQFILNEFHRCHYHTPAYENMLRDMGCYGEDSSRECDCVTHRSFSGLLESRIRCTACDSTTSTVDPMMDISLEIKSRKQVNNSKVDLQPVTVLETCLDRFTSSEKLDSKYYCNVCQESQIAHKQLFIKQMPVVLSIQLKVSIVR